MSGFDGLDFGKGGLEGSQCIPPGAGFRLGSVHQAIDKITQLEVIAPEIGDIPFGQFGVPGIGFFESGLVYDYLVMMFTSFLPFMMMRRSNTVSRKHGIILLLCYIGYLTYLIAKS